MRIGDTFSLSFGALRERKVRTVLTVLMVVAGSSMMVALNGLTGGFGAFIDRQFSSLAANVLTLTTAKGLEGGEGGVPQAPKITFNSAVVSRVNSLPFVNDVVPVYQGEVTLDSGGKSKSVSVYSIDPEKLLVIAPNAKLVEGSALLRNDRSAIIAATNVANPSTDPSFLAIGQTVRATYTFVDPDTGKQEKESKSFIVRGILETTGNPALDRSIIINSDIGNALLHKSGRFDSIQLVARSPEHVGAVEEEIRNMYGNNVGITTPQAALQTRQEITGGFSTFILAIAVVALVVGAVGIVTTLFTSVTERTREIGTMKALGAQKSDIMSLFLAEASMIGIMGATLGLAVGIAGGYVLTQTFAIGSISAGSMGIQPVFLASDLAYVWALSVALSLAAGLMPAWKASKLDPIVALQRN